MPYMQTHHNQQPYMAPLDPYHLNGYQFQEFNNNLGGRGGRGCGRRGSGGRSGYQRERKY